VEGNSVFTDALLPAGLAVIMFSLGLTLVPADFKRIFVLPKGVAIGLTNLLLLSPLLAFAVGNIYALAPTLAVGLVLLGASPGGTMANLLTHLARGDLALSVTMTAVSSVCAVITVPLFLSLGADHFNAQDVSDEISVLGVVARVFCITIIPLSLGMRFRHLRPARAQEIQPRLKNAALCVFAGIVIAAVATEWDRIAENFTDVAAAALTLNVPAMTVSYTISRIARLDERQSTAISMELGVHNSTLAIAVAAGVSTELAIPAAVYSAFMFITAGLFARLMYRRNALRVAAMPVSPTA
jgi:BASS family bile acid:Na+ symporter